MDVSIDSTSDVINSRISAEEFEAYLDDRDFQYDATTPRHEKSLWDRIKDWFYRKFMAPLFRGTSGELMEVLLILLAGLAFAVLIYYVLQARKKVTLAKSDVTWGEVFTDPTEINEKQFREWMDKAEANGDFKEAVKYLYLWCIKQMDVREYILYRPEYTNRQVLNKLKNEDVKSTFSSVATTFEHVFYGHFNIDKDEFNSLKSQILNSMLNS